MRARNRALARWLHVFWLAAGVCFAGLELSCSQAPVTVTLRSLQASGRVSFVCGALGTDGQVAEGKSLERCPDYDTNQTQLYALVTQTVTNEVAVINTYAGSVVDVDQAIPGFTFLHVGARPVDIVTTPGGIASFVGVAGVNKNGIFALPTSCLRAPRANQPPLDLTTWSACALSSAPGDMAVLIDPADASGTVASSCGGASEDPAPLGGDASRQCPANLTLEGTRDGGTPGRRKLAVALPDEGRIALIDAQSLLDRTPGSFDRCVEEASYDLKVELPATPIAPVLPPDLSVADGASCGGLGMVSFPPLSSNVRPRPAGMAVSGSKLYVADQAAPVVHVLDVSAPCSSASAELLPLLSYSYTNPTRTVTTSRLAVSPLTPRGKQFVYAVDELDQPSASLMAFDVSPGSVNRTPMVFPGAPRLPYEVPDRIRFAASVKDVAFALRDLPNATSATEAVGTLCNPDPAFTSDQVGVSGVAYRPNWPAFTAGARPALLRGVFGFALLSSGRVPIIDVEDFDAPCRRPFVGNRLSVEDFRGCANDPVALYDTADHSGDAQGTNPLPINPTVTDESSCKVVEPHRARSAFVSTSSATVGLRAPSLRTFPQFSNPSSGIVVAPEDRPHLLAVDFPNPDPSGDPLSAQVNVGIQLFSSADPSNHLELSPNADSVPTNSLTLPLNEPRAYLSSEDFTLSYEGKLTPDRSGGLVQAAASGAADSVLGDPAGAFCSLGVHDRDAMAELGQRELGLSVGDAAAFGVGHADYVQITGDFPPSDNSYWEDKGAGGDCGGRTACDTLFGAYTDSTLKSSRDLSIVQAFQTHLTVTPRDCLPGPNALSAEDCARRLAALECCFPADTAYTLRVGRQWLLSGSVSGTRHDMVAAPGDGRCVSTGSCDPRLRYFKSRVFEVSSSPCASTSDACRVGDAVVEGPVEARDVACTYDQQAVAQIEPGAAGSQCIFENLNARFVLYRGRTPSQRDMQFAWTVSGGFQAQDLSLLTQSPAVVPEAIQFVPQYGRGDVAVIDGSTLGLVMFDLDTLTVVSPSPFY